MRTTININDDLAEEIFILMPDKSKTSAINTALEDWIKSKKKEKLIAMMGKISIVDNIKELRNLDKERLVNGI
jgi:hypothetical protein